jgi:predicted transcriptional regulator
LQNPGRKFLPVIVEVIGANSVSNQSELADKFYRAVLSGLISAGSLENKHSKIKSAVGSHVPWIAASTVSALGLIFPPVAVGSRATQKVLGALLDKLGIKENGESSLLINKNIEPKIAVDFIVENLADSDIHPVFVIDELDKVPNDTMLSEFFNGNQVWFQGKRSIISLSHTFGQSVEKKIIESLGRFSQAQKIEGPTTVDQFKNVLYARLLLGISNVEPNESHAIQTVQKIFPDEIIEAIVNRYVPNLYLMLEHSYRAIQRARERNGRQLMLDDLEKFESTKIREPTEVELKILNHLSKNASSPKELIAKTRKNRGTITKSIKSLYSDNLIEKTGTGKNVKYSITQKGEAARALEQK